MSTLTPEGKVKRKLVEMLKRHGVWYFFPASNGFGKAGIPDVIACHNSKFIGIVFSFFLTILALLQVFI